MQIGSGDPCGDLFRAQPGLSVCFPGRLAAEPRGHDHHVGVGELQLAAWQSLYDLAETWQTTFVSLTADERRRVEKGELDFRSTVGTVRRRVRAAELPEVVILFRIVRDARLWTKVGTRWARDAASGRVPPEGGSDAIIVESPDGRFSIPLVLPPGWTFRFVHNYLPP